MGIETPPTMDLSCIRYGKTSNLDAACADDSRDYAKVAQACYQHQHDQNSQLPGTVHHQRQQSILVMDHKIPLQRFLFVMAFNWIK